MGQERSTLSVALKGKTTADDVYYNFNRINRVAYSELQRSSKDLRSSDWPWLDPGGFLLASVIALQTTASTIRGYNTTVTMTMLW